MKIYNKVVYDIQTWELIEEDSFEYEGEVVLCGSGGGETKVITTIPEKTETELELDRLQLEYIQRSMPVQEQLLEYQKETLEWQKKMLPQYLANQEMLLPAQKAEMEFYVKTMPQQLEIAGKQLGITEKQMAMQEEMMPLQKEVYTLQLEQAKKALAGEPLATEEQKKTLRTMADQYKAEATSGLEDIGETLYEQAIQKGLARGIPQSDIARGFESEVGKYIASERSSIEREGERMYTAGLTSYPTAMAEFAQRISQAPGYYNTTPNVSTGGYATPPMNQIGGTAQLPSGGVGGLDQLNQMLSQLKSERYALASTSTQNPSQSNIVPLASGIAGGVGGAFFGGPMGAMAGFQIGTSIGQLIR